MNSNAGRGFLKAIIIVGFVFAIAYFISYNNWMSHDFNKVDITYNLNSEQDYSDNNNDGELKDYSELYSKINFEFMEYNYGEEFVNIYYGGEKISNNYIIFIGVINKIRNNIMVNCNYETKISKEELDESIKSLLGNVSYEPKSFTTNNGYLTINYENEEYNIKVNGKCSGFDFSKGGIKNVYLKTEMNGGTLNIYEKALYLESTSDVNGNIEFKYHEGISKNSKVIANTFDSVDMDKIPTYVYQFEKVNNEYTLQRIVKK